MSRMSLGYGGQFLNFILAATAMVGMHAWDGSQNFAGLRSLPLKHIIIPGMPANQAF